MYKMIDSRGQYFKLLAITEYRVCDSTCVYLLGKENEKTFLILDLHSKFANQMVTKRCCNVGIYVQITAESRWREI